MSNEGGREAIIRCPGCHAVNAADADECSLCGEALNEDAESRIRYASARRADRRADRHLPPAVVADSDLADDDERLWPAHYVRASRRWLAALAAVEGAVVGAALLAVAVIALGMVGSLFGFLPGLDARGFVPLLPIGGGWTSWVATGAVAGGLAGAAVGLSRSTTPGVIVATAVFTAARAWWLMRLWAQPVFHRTETMVYSVGLAVAGVAAGAAFGYVVSLTVKGYLEAAGGETPGQ